MNGFQKARLPSDCIHQTISKESKDTNIVIGAISQWGEVKKKTKDRSVSKAKEPGAAPSDAPTSGGRGGRGRGGLESTRGGRGRGTDRGRGASRGARAASATASTNGPRNTKSANVEPSFASMTEPAPQVATGNWDTPAATTDSTPLESSWENVTAEAAQPTEPLKPSSKPDGTRSWASMFAKPKLATAPPKASQPIHNRDPPIEASIPATTNPISNDIHGLPPPAIVNETSEIPNTPPTSDFISSEVPPSGDELTETNLEQVPDTSVPVASATAASTVASTMDPRTGGTPLGGAQQHQPSGRPPMGGFATSAWKATGTPGRSASFQRKVLEQQEAVVMPGKHAVDRAAVQFGSMGLNGTPEDVDVDSDREDAETRAQPPQHSPVAPRAALPPAPQQQGFSSEPQAAEPLPIPRPAPGLPPLGQSSTTQQQDQASSEEQAIHAHPGSGPSGFPYNQFNDRYGAHAPSTQKSYEPFGQQASQPSQTEAFPSASQSGQQAPQAAFSSAGNDMSSFYTSDTQRNAYQNNFYSGYGQQPHQQGHETGRAGSAFGTSAPGQGSQHAISGQQHAHGRFGQANEAHASGNSTPNPSMSSQQQPNPSHHMMGQQQGQGHAGGQYGGYPGGYGHPYGPGYYSSYSMNQVSNHPYGRERPLFDDVRRYDDHYLTQAPQYGYGGSQGGYGSGPFGSAGGKGAMYGQGHQGYNQSPYDQHSASPANAGTFGSQLPSSGRESAAAGGLGSYGRSGSAQPADTPYSGSGTGSHSNVPDPFGGRAQSAYQGHNQGLGSGMGQGGNDDALRGYGGESKVPGGPSPALGQPGGRPGSTQGQSSAGQGGYGAYPSHMNPGIHGQQGSQYNSGHGHQSGGQNHQGAGYGAYGAGYGGNYYSSSNRGGWGAGANYGH